MRLSGTGITIMKPSILRLPSLMAGALLALAMPAAPQLFADEGMWLFNAPPSAILKERHQFETTDAWLDHLQKSSVRFNSGGSGSFVSEDGLVMSNHHVGADALQKFGDKDHNYLKDGFWAKTYAEEKKCLDLELNVLMSIEDVTDKVNAAVKPDLAPAEAFAARRAVMAGIEKESTDKTGLRSDIVTLYQGGQYHLYRFKRYTDVRLVFAPEQQIAFFGGDPDNFEYPRFDLDICFFRVYENDKPAKIEQYLKWGNAPLKENDLVFVSGHPGRTSRLLTLSEIEYLRDISMPYTMAFLHRQEVLLTAYSARSEENARRAREDLFGVQNSRKAREGGLAGLLDPEFIGRKRADETALREAAKGKDELKDYLGAWDKIRDAQTVIGQNAMLYRLLEGEHGFRGELFSIARTLLRAGDELTKPDGERLREFRESGLPSMEFSLFSAKPIYDDLETLLLSDSLTWLAGRLGSDHPVVIKALAGQSPRQRAADLVLKTKLKEVSFRKTLYQGGKNAIDLAKDPMLELARAIDDESRAVRKIMESQDEIKQQAHAQVGKVRFAVQGTSTYPDATFTLRLAYGLVKGYEEAGRKVPFQTTMAGLYDRWNEQKGRPPFDLPKRWLDRKKSLDLNTPFNFISTADIIGGNSGSPVVNRDGEFVGIIFDGNIQSLVLDYYYTETQARALAVNSQAIIESLRKVYGAGPLADELQGKHKKP